MDTPKNAVTFEELNKLLTDVFATNGNGFAKVFKNYNLREDQVTMARVIMKALYLNKAGIIEAGTGTGKSFGESIPAVIFARLTGKKVAICTHTIALQQQLYLKDMPIVQKVLNNFGIDFSYVLLKGKGNFVCARKLAKIIAAKDSLEAKDKEELNKYIKHAQKDGAIIIGDKDKLPYKPDDLFWPKISASMDEPCDGCQFKKEGCFYNHLKKVAKEADILVTNHSLLMADLIARRNNNYKPESGLIPDYDILIIDEAHHIDDVASEFLGHTITDKVINKILMRARVLFAKNGPLKTQVDEQNRSKVFEKCKTVEDEMKRVFAKVRKTINDIGAKNNRPVSAIFIKKLYGIEIDIQVIDDLIGTLMFNAIRIDEQDARSTIKSIADNLTQLKDHLNYFNDLKNEEEFVYWAHKEKESAVLKVTPVQVNTYLREGLFDRMPVILTSATIKFAKDLSMFAKKVGNLEYDEYESAYMNSPFDYEKQVCFYVPPYALDGKNGDGDTTEYDEYCQNEMLDLIKMSKGRAFLLFTSYSSMNKYAEKMKPIIESMGYLVLKQGDFERNQLVQKFKEHGNAVLFGADSFWEGIDIPGRELSLVIIHKIPFSVPNPVSDARGVRIEQNGGDAFLEGFVFSAVTKYKQGFGRLIRHENDKGVFCVLDGRILSQKEKYGKYFLSSMPKTQKTMNKEDLIPFFE